MKRVLTDAQVAEAAKLYFEQKLPSNEIASIFGCTSTTIQREFKKAGLILRDSSRAKQKYHINESVFDCIDAEEKAYWLGFLYADGNVSKTNRTRLSLVEEDREVLEKFSNFIFNQERIKYYKLPANKIVKNLFYVDVCNKHIAKKLTDLGCPPNKTFILTFPNWLPNFLQNHFIRGYFDGDGCLSNYKEKLKSKGKLTKGLIIGEADKSEFSILSTKEFLIELQKIFSGIEINSSMSKRHKNRNSNNFTLKVHGNQQIQKLMDWLYKDASLFLQRKYEKYLQLKEINL